MPPRIHLRLDYLTHHQHPTPSCLKLDTPIFAHFCLSTFLLVPKIFCSIRMLTQPLPRTVRQTHLRSLRLRSAFCTSARTCKKQPNSHRLYQKNFPPHGLVSKLTLPKYHQQPFRYEIGIPSKAAELPSWKLRSCQVLGVTVAVAGLGIFWWTHREQVPITGRWRFYFMSNYVLKRDNSTYPAMIKEIEPVVFHDNHPTAILVRRVLDRLLPSSGLEHLNWKLHVVNAPGICNQG